MLSDILNNSDDIICMMYYYCTCCYRAIAYSINASNTAFACSSAIRCYYC